MYWPTVDQAVWNPIYQPDPYAAYVFSLLHLNGTNGSTTITDNGLGTTTWSCNGAAAISTAQYKFNGSSLKVPSSNGDEVNSSLALGNALATQLFTIEFWYFPIVTPPSATSGLITFGAGPMLGLYADNSGKIELWLAGILAGTSVLSYTVGAWNYLVWQREGGDLHRLFINGMRESSTYHSTQTAAGYTCILGNQNNGGAPANFYFAEFRFTIGVNRYTSNFSPPFAPFPNPS